MLVGLIPIFSRLLVWLVTVNGTVNLLSATDFISFGLILHISNINEIEHITSEETSWKTVQNGVSIMFIAFYSVLFALALLNNNTPVIIKARIIDYCSVILATISFIISYSVIIVSIITFTIILTIIGFSVAIWSIFDTRNKYYQDYLNRKQETTKR